MNTNKEALPGSAERFITKHDVAFRLGVGTRTVTRYMRDGVFPYYRMRRRVHFKWSEVDRAIMQHFRKKE